MKDFGPGFPEWTELGQDGGLDPRCKDEVHRRFSFGAVGHAEPIGRNSDKGNRLFVEAVIWKFRSSAPWRDLPERFGGWKNTHTRFSRWAASGVWGNLFEALADDPDNEYAMIDVEPLERHWSE